MLIYIRDILGIQFNARLNWEPRTLPMEGRPSIAATQARQVEITTCRRLIYPHLRRNATQKLTDFKLIVGLRA